MYNLCHHRNENDHFLLKMSNQCLSCSLDRLIVVVYYIIHFKLRMFLFFVYFCFVIFCMFILTSLKYYLSVLVKRGGCNMPTLPYFLNYSTHKTFQYGNYNYCSLFILKNILHILYAFKATQLFFNNTIYKI